MLAIEIPVKNALKTIWPRPKSNFKKNRSRGTIFVLSSKSKKEPEHMNTIKRNKNIKEKLITSYSLVNQPLSNSLSSTYCSKAWPAVIWLSCILAVTLSGTTNAKSQ